MKKYYPYVEKIVVFFRLNRFLERDEGLKKSIDLLYPRKNKEQIWKELWYQRISMILLVLVISVLLFLVCIMSEVEEAVIEEGRYIHGNTEKNSVTFQIRTRTDKGVAEDELTVDVKKETEEETKTEKEPEIPWQDEVLEPIKEEVKESVSKQLGKERIELPQTVSGRKVEYANPEAEKDYSPFYLSVVILFLLPALWKRKQTEQLQARENQLMLDYPEIVNKIMLLLSAGLTLRGCFERICEEYTKRLKQGGERRYAYEEICISYQEMQNGVSESEAIETFGKRCCQLPYLKFSSIISQNIRKGSEGLTEMLEMEAIEAFEKRKETVKMLGETAGTKLLLPMMLMLGVVMMIIIVPAFMTM